MAWKVLTTARAFWVSGKPALDALMEAGCEVVSSPKAGPLQEDELVPFMGDCDAIIASNDQCAEKLFAASPHLKVVSRCGVGIDTIDLGAATQAGVMVTRTPGAMTDSVAEYTFGLLLAVARNIAKGDATMKSGGWGEYPGVMLKGKTIGIVGYGDIGQAAGNIARGFGMRVLAHDPPRQLTGKVDVDFVDLDTLLAESDFVSVHAPAMPETDGMFDAGRFSQMKKTAYFVNTARGALTDEMALVEALEKGVIAGAAIDVYRREPLPADHPLRKAPNVVLTPHNAFNSVEAVEGMSVQSAVNILKLLKGELPVGLCNPEVLTTPQLRWKLVARTV